MMARKVMTGASGFDITSDSHPNLICKHTGDNISGSTSIDDSSNGLNGTITGATIVAAHLGNGYSFDGINDDVTIASVPQWSGEYTLCFIFKPNTTTPGSANDEVYSAITDGVATSMNIYYDSTSGTFRGKIRYFQGVPEGGGDVGQVDWLGGNVLSTSRFYFLFAKINGTSASSALYDDTGSLVHSGSTTLSSGLFSDASNTIYIAQIGGGSAFAQVVLDNLRAFDIELNSSQEADIVNGGTGA